MVPWRMRSLSCFSLLSWMFVLGSCSEAPTGNDGRERPPTYLTEGIDQVAEVSPGATREFIGLSVAAAGMRLFFQGLSGSASDSLVLTLRRDSLGPTLGTLSTVGTQAAIGDRVLYIPAEPAAVRYFITVRGAAADDKGAFRLSFRAPGPGPEMVPALIVVGDTLTGERLDALVESDRFEFEAESGSEYVFALTMEETRPNRNVWMRLMDGYGNDFGNMLTNRPFGWGQGDLERRSFRFQLNGTHRFVLHVEAGRDVTDPPPPDPVVDGRYRLWVRKVNPLPEARPAIIAFGDTIVDAIDAVGDVDTYSFHADSGAEYRLDLWWARTQSDPIRLSVIGPRFGLADEGLTVPPERADGLGWSFAADRTGLNTIRLRGGVGGARDSVTTPYRMELRRVVRAPESRSATLLPADTVIGEAIERPGDIDEFLIDRPVGAITAIRLTAGPDLDGVVSVSAIYPSGQEAWSTILNDANPGADASVMAYEPGPIMIRVAGELSSVGGYRIELTPIDRAPETVPAILPVGVWVTGESLEPAADVDDFSFPGVDRQRYNLLIDLDPGSTGDPVLFLDAPTDLWFTTLSRGGALGSFIAQSNDDIRFHVTGAVAGTYRLFMYAIDTLPESTPPARAFGDTLRTESIDAAGDIDEFRFGGTVGQRVRIAVGSDDARTDIFFTVAVFDPETGGLLVTPTSLRTEDLVLPRTGSYRVVVKAATSQDIVAGAGRYRVSTTILP